MSLTDRAMAKLRPLLNRVSRRSLRIYLAPQRIIVTAFDGAKVAGAVALPVANADGRWHAPLAALRVLLQQADKAGVPASSRAMAMADGGTRGPDSPHHQPGHAFPAAEANAIAAALASRASISFSLAGRWCQAAMAPWSDALLAEPGATRFLRMQLAAVYGDAAQGWTVTADDAPYGQPRLACGIDNELLLALRAACAELRYPCAAIEPVLATVCRQMPAGAAFAIAEQGRLTLAAPAQGRVAAIHTQPCGGAWPLELERAWQRWSLRLPELDAGAGLDVIDLTGMQAAQLPQSMRAAASPFGAPALTDLPPVPHAEALCA